MDQLDGLTTHLLAIAPQGLGVVARSDSLLLADLAVAIQDLGATAPNDSARRAIDGVRGPLGQLHAAVDLVAVSPSPTEAELTLVHQWAQALHVATSTARASLAAHG